MTHGGKEAALLRQGAGIGHHREGVHLQAIVVVEAQRGTLNHPLVQLKARGFQPLFGAGMAGIENGHIVLFRHGVDGGKQGEEVFLRIDILLPVGGQQNVLPFLKAQSFMDIGSFDCREVGMEHLRHGGAGDIGPLLGQAAVVEVFSCVLGIGQIHVGNDVHDAPVGFLRQALVLAAVARLHVEDGDVQPLGADDTQAAVGISQHQHRIGPDGGHELIGLGDDIAHGLAQIGTNGV